MTAALVCYCIKNIRVARVKMDFADAGIFTDLQDRLPVLPAVGCFIETAIATGGPERSICSDIDNI